MQDATDGQLGRLARGPSEESHRIASPHLKPLRLQGHHLQPRAPIEPQVSALHQEGLSEDRRQRKVPRAARKLPHRLLASQEHRGAHLGHQSDDQAR